MSAAGNGSAKKRPIQYVHITIPGVIGDPALAFARRMMIHSVRVGGLD